MGNLCSTAAATDAATGSLPRVLSSPRRRQGALDEIMATKVTEYIAEHRVEPSKSLNQIIMKFPAVSAGPGSRGLGFRGEGVGRGV
jgi:hypothetical protein